MRKSVFTLACCVFATASAESQTELDPVVVTATGFEQKITDAPASISVVTQEDIAKRPYTSLIDVVRDLEGVDVGETSDKTGQRTISLRGMGADYTLILIDGRRQNNHGDIYPNSFGGNQFNHIPPLDAIERVEVIRGPAATLYGADALGGVINIITKKDAKEWSGSVTFGRSLQSNNEFGDDTTTDFSLRGPIVPGMLSMNLRGSYYDRAASHPTLEPKTDPNGVLRTPSIGFGGGGKTVDNQNKAYGFSLHLTPDSRQRVSFDYDNSKQVYDNTPFLNPNGTLGFPLGTVDSIDTIWRTVWTGTATNGKSCSATNNTGTCKEIAAPQAGYSSNQEFTREAWSLSHEGRWGFGTSSVALSYVETDNKGRTTPFTVAEREHLLDMIKGQGAYGSMTEAQRKAAAEAAFLPRNKRTLQSNQYTLDAKLDIPLNDLAGEHLLVLGTQFIDGELNDSVFGMEDGAPGGIQAQKMWALFIEDNWMPTDDFTLTAGLRHDKHKVFGGQMSPRIYGVYRLGSQWTAKGGVTTGYKTPKTTQLYDGITGFGGQGVSPMFGNPDLKPETSVNTEVAIYWNHPRRHSFNATWFKNDFKDKISSQPCGPTTPYPCAVTGEYAGLGYATSNKAVNIDKAAIQGAELAARLQITDAWALRGNYTYTDSEQKSGSGKGQPLTSSVKHMFNAVLDWQATPDLSVALTLEARAKRYRDQNPITKAARYYRDYEIFHLGASYRLNKNVSVNGRINNLLDKDFTTYGFSDCTGTSSSCVGGWAQLDDYNNKEKARNFWVSVTASF